MTPLLFLLLSVAGGVGAVLRFVLDGIIRAHLRVSWPVGTLVINVSGSLLLGVLVGLGAGGTLGSDWVTVLGTGLLGGYTTFSTASFETVRLVQQRRWAVAAANGVGMLVVSIAAAALGLWLGNI